MKNINKIISLANSAIAEGAVVAIHVTKICDDILDVESHKFRATKLILLQDELEVVISRGKSIVVRLDEVEDILIHWNYTRIRY